jgi:hypothetical protein
MNDPGPYVTTGVLWPSSSRRGDLDLPGQDNS